MKISGLAQSMMVFSKPVLAWLVAIFAASAFIFASILGRTWYKNYQDDHQRSINTDSVLIASQREILDDIEDIDIRFARKFDSIGKRIEATQNLTNEKLITINYHISLLENNDNIYREFRKLDSLFRMFTGPYQKKTLTQHN